MHGGQYLELEDLIFRVSQLLQAPLQLTLILRTRLVARDRLIKTRRTTDKDLNILLLRLGQNSLQQVLSNKAFAPLPALWRLVQCVESLEALRICVLELVEFVFEQDVLFADVAEDQAHFCFVFGVLEDAADYLVHWCYACAACDHGYVAVLVG